MSAHLAIYETAWNELSWSVGGARDACFAMLGSGDWMNNHVAKLQRGDPVPTSRFMSSVMTFCNALTTHFFVGACRVREKTNSKSNLITLLSAAKKHGMLTHAEQSRADEIVALTETTFEQLRQARGRAVAHLHDGSNPHMLLKDGGITRKHLFEYFENLDELFWLLGKPIGKVRTGPTGIDRSNQVSKEIQQTFDYLWPSTIEINKLIVS